MSSVMAGLFVFAGFTANIKAQTPDLLVQAKAGSVKYIEAEDFNYDSGHFKTFEEVDKGGAYKGLGAVRHVDFYNRGNSSAKYRHIPGNIPA